ncbi:MAG: FAD-dependent oxidoreductase, partial [Candidatus Cloacimonetes bacterium]|nr:FAD-dependent oxidoreductase [Candidatus Cloacimonadota bacterium]
MKVGVDPIVALRETVSGQVIGPGDEGYETGRRGFFSFVDRRPAAIVRPVDAGDVARVVLLAREMDLELAVRSGGHSMAGHSSTEGGILLDLSSLDSIDIDVGRRTAWVGGGVTAGAITKAAGEHGLALG